MLRIEIVTTDGDLRALEPAWEALWRRAPRATPFQSPRWLLPWWDAFGNDAPRVVAAWSGKRLAGVLPLYVRNESRARKLLPIGISLSDYFDALVDPDDADVIEALVDAIVRIPDWDEGYLPELPPNAALLRANALERFRPARAQLATCPYLALPRTVDALGKALPPKIVRNLRQVRQRAQAVGPLRIDTADAATLDACIDTLLRLHALRWGERGGEGVCADAAVERFHRACIPAMHAAGLLRLHVLHVGDAPVAAYYGLLANGAAYAYLSGFDPAHPQWSPGTQIVGHAIEDAVRHGAGEFHFLRGGEAYKYLWGAQDRFNTALVLSPPAARAVVTTVAQGCQAST